LNAKQIVDLLATVGEELVAVELSSLLRDSALTLARSDLPIFAERLDRAIGLDLISPIAEDPGVTDTVGPRLYLGMLNTRLHS